MERHLYESYNSYLQAQLTKTERCWFDGRRLSQHLHNISELLNCLLKLSRSLSKDASVVCMGARRGLELVAWNALPFGRLFHQGVCVLAQSLKIMI